MGLATPYREAPCTDFTIYTSNDVVSHKDVPFGVPKTKFHISIGVEEFKYGVTGDPYLQVRRGHVTYF